MSIPVRDVASLRGGATAGHEKFPSWPVAAAQETPPVLRGPHTGGSTRSKSWTDHTEYPKEQPLTYTRPYMKRQLHNPNYNKQLKTVMERCEKIPPEVFESRRYSHNPLPCLDRDGKSFGDLDYAVPSPPERDTPPLTQADLEAYLHHKQPSYAQSEGYHSYVSSTDSSSTATPFLDRLRRDSEAKNVIIGGRDSVVTTSSGSASASSSETLKWHGSMSDVSTHSHQHTHQLIAHSSRVQTPQRHHSESVLYMDPQQRKLFPVSTYTVQPHHHHTANITSLNSTSSSTSVADRVNELERNHIQKYTYLDPEKKHRVSDPTLKAIQKKALLSFYERHHGTWRSEPQLAVPQAPQPPPRCQLQPQIQAQPQTPSRRASSASDYAGSLRRGPVIVGPAISVDEWVPERPPKNPALRNYRAITPPPPSPPPTPDVESYNSDEPLPPPPSELLVHAAPPPPARSWQRQSFMHKPLPPVPMQEPPPLHPRQNRVNQSMRARIGSNSGARKSPPNRHSSTNHMSASKASYLASRRERELNSCPTDTGSYKRTMSPGGDIRDPCTRLQPQPQQPTITTTTTLIRRASITETPKSQPPLPDVLPSPPRIITPPTSPKISPKSSIVSPRPLVMTVSPVSSSRSTNSSRTSVASPRTSVSSSRSPTSPRSLEKFIISSTSPISSICSPARSPSSSSPQPLQLMQRTEVTLRVNATTSDAGCQTEEDGKEIDLAEDKKIIPTRKKLQEEIECERLQQDLAEHLAPSDRLKCILVPGPEHRKPTDYVSASGLFKVELTSRCRSTSANTSSSTNTSSPPPTPPSLISTTSAYFTTSESKAKFLISSRDLHITSKDFSVTSTDLERKKEELVSRLARKLEVLRSESDAVAEERRVNEELGAEVGKRVARSARPHEAAKFRLHVDEVGQITALLLGLSGRLARAENALMSLDESPTNCDPLERKSLEDKRDKLAAQLTEAKQLKESIDKRSGHVSNMLVQYLNADEYADYDHFINMKAKLIMDARDISDKIKLGEEQLQALKDTLADV